MHPDSPNGTTTDSDAIARLVGISKVYEPSSRLLSVLVRSSITSPVHALSNIDLSVGPGQIKAIVGPNGAGKTTLFRIVVGLTTPTTGSASVLEFDATSQAERARRHIGFMPSDDRSLFMRLTCAENLRFHGRIHGMKGEMLTSAVRESLDAVGIGHRHDSAVFSLSAGMRARVQLARAIIHRPRLLVLDEPTATIDPVASHELLGLLVDLVERYQMGALISSHRLEEIEALSTNVVLLDQGRTRFDGDLADLRSELDRPNFELLFSDERVAAEVERTVGDLAEVLDSAGAMVVLSPNANATIGDVLGSIPDHVHALEHCREQPMPLRDLLARMYREPDTSVPATAERS